MNPDLYFFVWDRLVEAEWFCDQLCSGPSHVEAASEDEVLEIVLIDHWVARGRASHFSCHIVEPEMDPSINLTHTEFSSSTPHRRNGLHACDLSESQSCRRLSIGSTLVARYAGSQQAKRPTKANPAAATVNDSGS